MPQPPLVLLTDFGTRDAYVGMVKAVLACLAPESRHIDLTHAIPPGRPPDIGGAACIPDPGCSADSFRWYPS